MFDIKIFLLFCSFFFIIVFVSCIQKNIVKEENQVQIQEEKIDCNYYWPARKVHVCIKDMPKKECESLFSLGQFFKEEKCYCDIPSKEKNYIQGENYIQYDCR